jgi:NAD(P)-dependent dehydrogenase (short-subunit alcohol dehydrogenase family)
VVGPKRGDLLSLGLHLQAQAVKLLLVESRSVEHGPGPEQRKAQQLHLARRLIDAREIAYVVSFLASPKAVAINGEFIGVGGGQPGAISY